VAIVWLPLHSWRSTIITGLALPIAVTASFIAVSALGFTLNLMTMMALSLCIGPLIDDAIVVRENVVRHPGMGKGQVVGAREGIDEIGLSVMATTLAICAVFVPVALMDGFVGKFFCAFGITVVDAVVVSLFVSIAPDPMKWSVWQDPPEARLRALAVAGALMRATGAGMPRLRRAYARLIGWVFARRRRDRLIVLGVAIASFAGALAFVPLAGGEFIPQTDLGYTQLSLGMPTGASLARSDEKVRQVGAIVAGFPEVKTVSAAVGGTGTGFAIGRNQASIDIGMVERRQRTRSQKQIEDAIRAEIARIPGIEATLGFDRPIHVAILGTDPEGLIRVGQDFADEVRKVPGTADVELAAKPGLPAFAVRLRGPTRCASSGSPRRNSRPACGPTSTATSLPTGPRPTASRSKCCRECPWSQRERGDQMRALPVALARDGTPIARETVATMEPPLDPDGIRRENLQRREAIFAGVQGRPAGDVGGDVQKLVKETVPPQGYSFDVRGATRDQAEAFQAMLGAMLLAVIFMCIVPASRFGSFVQPIAIMA
jgi:multidrug efflux pump subunit AcrB